MQFVKAIRVKSFVMPPNKINNKKLIIISNKMIYILPFPQKELESIV